MNAKTDLQWNVLTIKRPGLVRDLPPGKEELRWVANSSTLICGERDAILVDTFLTTEQSQTLLDWIVASGENLTAIYITRRIRLPLPYSSLPHPARRGAALVYDLIERRKKLLTKHLRAARRQIKIK